MSDFPTQALLETTDRIAARWKKALADIGQAKYGPNEWLRDAVGFWLEDIAGGLGAAGTGTRVVLLTQNNQQSDKILVSNLTKVNLTNLGQLGGTKAIKLAIDKFPDAPGSQNGSVTVRVPPGGLTPPLPSQGEQYVGLLYEDQAPLATVIYLQL
jgi:hypothetical protein